MVCLSPHNHVPWKSRCRLQETCAGHSRTLSVGPRVSPDPRIPVSSQSRVFLCVQPCTTTLCGCPLPSTHRKALGSATQGHVRDRDSRAAPGNLRTRGNFGKPIQEGVPGMQRGTRAKLPRPTIQSSETIVPAITHEAREPSCLRDSRATLGNSHDMKATWAKLFRMDYP